MMENKQLHDDVVDAEHGVCGMFRDRSSQLHKDIAQSNIEIQLILEKALQNKESKKESLDAQIIPEKSTSRRDH